MRVLVSFLFIEATSYIENLQVKKKGELEPEQVRNIMDSMIRNYIIWIWKNRDEMAGRMRL